MFYISRTKQIFEYFRIYSHGTRFIVKNVCVDAPNLAGGIGELSGELVDSPCIWTGYCHLSVPKNTRVSIHFASITRIEMLDDYLSECSIKVLFYKTDEERFSYKPWFKLAKRIREVQASGRKQ